MYIPYFSLQGKPEHIIDCANHTKSENQHSHALPVLFIGKENNGNRHISQRGANYGNHCGDTGNYKPEPRFFYTDNQVTNQTHDALEQGNDRNTDCITDNHTMNFFTQ